MTVTIKFLGLGYNNNYQAFVKIFDDKGNLVIKKKTYNGEIKVKLKNCKKYKLKAYFLNETLNRCFWVTPYINKFIYYFNHSLLNTNTNLVTFLLTDSNYNLPIERGMINLWQRQ